MPLTAAEAKKVVRRFLAEGTLTFVRHARDEMAKDGLFEPDVMNVLRGGICREAEYENGNWRFRLETPRIVVVITFRPEPETELADDVDLEATELIIITVWRI